MDERIGRHRLRLQIPAGHDIREKAAHRIDDPSLPARWCGNVKCRLREFYGEPMSHPLVSNAISWQLAVGLLRHAEENLTIRETHPGGGQYDCLEIVDGDTPNPSPSYLTINRCGSIHFMRSGAASVPDEVWDEPRTHGAFSKFSREMLELAGLTWRSDARRSDRSLLTVRVIAEVVATTALTATPWDARAAFHDSSGPGGSSVAEGATRGFPGVGSAPSHEVWLLGPAVDLNAPRVRLHRGYAINDHAEVVDLERAYRNAHRALEDVALRVRRLA